jgi:uncharacterized membrane protein YphA (DoxX/SURF4 family)
MNNIQRLEHWGEAHHPKYMDILRIALGIFLLLKGVEFANNSSSLSDLMSRQISFNGFLLLLLSHYIIFAHIAGGFLLAVGLLTRVACIVQIPVLLGALFLVHWDVMEHLSDFFVTLIVLALVVWFFIIGSGPWSLDAAFEKGEQRR